MQFARLMTVSVRIISEHRCITTIISSSFPHHISSQLRFLILKTCFSHDLNTHTYRACQILMPNLPICIHINKPNFAVVKRQILHQTVLSLPSALINELIRSRSSNMNCCSAAPGEAQTLSVF